MGVKRTLQYLTVHVIINFLVVVHGSTQTRYVQDIIVMSCTIDNILHQALATLSYPRHMPCTSLAFRDQASFLLSAHLELSVVCLAHDVYNIEERLYCPDDGPLDP